MKTLLLITATLASGIAFAEAFAKTTECRIRSHEKFATAVIILPDDFKIELMVTGRS